MIITWLFCVVGLFFMADYVFAKQDKQFHRVHEMMVQREKCYLFFKQKLFFIPLLFSLQVKWHVYDKVNKGSEMEIVVMKGCFTGIIYNVL